MKEYCFEYKYKLSTLGHGGFHTLEDAILKAEEIKTTAPESIHSIRYFQREDVGVAQPCSGWVEIL